MKLAVRLGLPTVTRLVTTVQSSDEFILGDEANWIQKWDRANDKLNGQRQTPMDLDIGVLPGLPADIDIEAQEVLADVHIKRTLGTLPYRWAWVELRRLIAWQSYVNLTHVERLERELPDTPSNADLLHFILRDGHAQPPVTKQLRDGNHVRFTSRSNDLRVLDTVILDPRDIQGYIPFGRPSSAVVIYIGYSLNILCATYMHKRLVLTNGTHHAYALYSRGATHAPCLVREVISDRQLPLAGAPDTEQPFEWYFTAARPPLLGDFFDEELVSVIKFPDTLSELDFDLRFSTSLVRIPP